jgi:hypothetical protein
METPLSPSVQALLALRVPTTVTSTLGGLTAAVTPNSPSARAVATLSRGRTLATLLVERAGTLALAGKFTKLLLSVY